MIYPESFQQIVNAFQNLPGVGNKTAQRYAFEIMNWDPEKQKTFRSALDGLERLTICKECGNLSENDICNICSDKSRNHNIICVVQSSRDIAVIESMQQYNGIYHVINGAINTKKGILPEDLNIHTLIHRIHPETEEVILAMNPTVEGETTSLYIERLLQDKVKVSRLAAGIPMGGQLEYIDSRTLQKAFEGRRSS